MENNEGFVFSSGSNFIRRRCRNLRFDLTRMNRFHAQHDSDIDGFQIHNCFFVVFCDVLEGGVVTQIFRGFEEFVEEKSLGRSLRRRREVNRWASARSILLNLVAGVAIREERSYDAGTESKFLEQRRVGGRVLRTFHDGFLHRIVIRIPITPRPHVHVAGIFPVARQFSVNSENENERGRSSLGWNEFVGKECDERSGM